DPNAACATSSANGEPIPVDLYFMVDITGSMNCPVPQDPKTPCEVDPGPPYSATTRWTVESAALSAFVKDPMNDGLGVGIRFFPSQNNICNAATYVKPAVEIGVLPGSAKALDASIMGQTPGGNTPTVPSLDGALQHAAAWAKANPTHRVAVVYATDGYPKGCDANNTIAEAAKLADTAFMGKPSIPTYVLGVGPNLTDLNSIAMSGGTTKAFLVDTTKDAAAQLSAALASIRTTALVGCTYTVPAPPAGQMLDLTKVNVTYTDSAGKVTTVLQDPPGTTCDNGMGWEYSANNTQIDLCGSLCDSIKANPGGSLQVLFGCDTQVGKPK
ncbi:MAG TPA: vWA domain-containing protein, partial [Polyangiaceae bacterium]|nr:vWA domain-containing protein [Polyangiaceae bacterium]